MSGSFSVENGKIVITHDGRTVSTTDGTLINFLADPQSYNLNAAYPDADKQELYSWSFTYSKRGSSTAVVSWGTSAVGALPQEYSHDYVLGAAPAGADIFLGRIGLSRIANPSHVWAGRPLTPLVPLGVYMPINGSLMLEQGFGISRAMSVLINGGNLVLNVQHSVSVGGGGFRQWGPQQAPYPPPPFDADRNGGENQHSGTPSSLVYSPTSAPGRKQSQFNNPSSTDAPSLSRWHARNGNNPAVYSDPTNFSSTYSVNIQGRFGRRS